MPTIKFSPFCRARHWRPDFVGTRVLGVTPEDLERLGNQALAGGQELAAGYAPFSKHLFLPNPSETRMGSAAITQENAHLLRTDYRARRSGELPVLVRWLEEVEAPRALFLDIILYSQEQMFAEAAANPNKEPADYSLAEWWGVAVIGTMAPEEEPMEPITILRNALGKEEGGSGVPIDREKYAKAVEYWRRRARLK